MRVIIAGGREVKDAEADRLVSEAIEQSGWKHGVTKIIHGAARGVDSSAGRLSTWPVMAMPADWNEHGRAAGPIRNKEMAKVADALIAIRDGESRGTKNMIETAKKMGLSVYVHRYERDKDSGEVRGAKCF